MNRLTLTQGELVSTATGNQIQFTKKQGAALSYDAGGNRRMDSLLKHPGVLDTTSSFALERLKETTALPLTHLK